MPLETGDTAPDFESLLCDGEVFKNRRLDDVLGSRGAIVYFQGFAFSAIARHWWTRFERNGWHEFDGVPVVGVSRDGPFAQNAFIRTVGSPFPVFSDVDGSITDEFGIRTSRDGMANTTVPRRSSFVLDTDRKITYRWIAEDVTTPPAVDGIEEAVAAL
jgi:peroxiredoxin